MAQLRHPDAYPLLMGSYWLWYPALALYPVVLIIMACPAICTRRPWKPTTSLDSLQLLLAVVLLDALAMRWLLVVRRRISYEAALERRRAARKRPNAEPGANRAARPRSRISRSPRWTSRHSAPTPAALIRFSLGLSPSSALMLIWADLLPALRCSRITCSGTTVSVDGEEQQRPVTLAAPGPGPAVRRRHLGAAQRLPALLEIVLLRRYAMSAADRYAVTTLTSYVIGAVGILLVLGTLGASWMQLQWMAAALSVGIGFGLQEIVANFISGLIILFERPIRVGDTVTVGDTDGVVTKIRIRATTIRNFDRKELLVPNKEFVTGRLLNWSLSDPVTRIVLVVGVAYGSDVDQGVGDHDRHRGGQRARPGRAAADSDLRHLRRQRADPDPARLCRLRRCAHRTISALNRAINQAFADAGISIAFPQRDLHLDTTRPLQIELRGSETTPEARGSQADPSQ
jgi:potassium efflux system protein